MGGVAIVGSLGRSAQNVIDRLDALHHRMVLIRGLVLLLHARVPRAHDRVGIVDQVTGAETGDDLVHDAAAVYDLSGDSLTPAMSDQLLRGRGTLCGE